MNQLNYQLLEQTQLYRPVIQTEILAAGSYLPPEKVSSKDLMSEIGTELRYGMSHTWMSDSMGIYERRMVDDEVTPSELAIKAARNALESNPDIDRDEIDAVIFCGIERDLPEPATAHIIQRKLGLSAAHTFDVANACFGFYEGVKLASSMIQSGAVRYALVVTGEISTKMARRVVEQLKRGVDAEQAKHLWGMLSVGDAGGALILGPAFEADVGFQKFSQRSESQHSGLCHYRWRKNGDVVAHMNMAHIVARGLKLNKSLHREVFTELGWEQFDWVLAHQTGQTSFEHAIALHGVKERQFIKTFDTLGNITTATLPVSFQRLRASGNLKRGDRISGLFAGSGLVAGQFGYIV